MDTAEFYKRLDGLIENGISLVKDCPSVINMDVLGGGIELNMQYKKWRLSCLNLMRTYFGENHHFYKELKETKSTWTMGSEKDKHHFTYCKESIANEVAVLNYIKEELSLGLVTDAQHMYQSELFSNLLDQAFNLCNNGYLVASAVFGRLIIENYINDLLRANQIEVKETEKLPNKLTNLRSKDIIDLPTERIIQSHYDIGTYAVHGKKEFKNYNTKEKIMDFLNIIQNKILTISYKNA